MTKGGTLMTPTNTEIKVAVRGAKWILALEEIMEAEHAPKGENFSLQSKYKTPCNKAKHLQKN